MPLTIFLKKQKKNLIVFVHGLSGNRDTWIKQNQDTSLVYWLQKEKIVQDNFDLGFFEYTSHLVKLAKKTNFMLNVVFKDRHPYKKNLDINQIVKVLATELNHKAQNYSQIVLIGHSMGGLICKNFILNNSNSIIGNKIKLFLSIAVPHKGSDFALLGKMILKKNPQIKNLNSLSPVITSLNTKWLEQDEIPKTTYLIGLNDTIVPSESAVAAEKQPDIEFFEKDHFNIIVPADNNDSVVRVIVNRLTQCLKRELIYENKKSKYIGNEAVNTSTVVNKVINIDKNNGKIIVEKDEEPARENDIELEGANNNKLKQDCENAQGNEGRKKNRISLKNSSGNEICQDTNNQ